MYLDEYSFWYRVNFLKTTIMQVRPLSTGLVLRSQLEPQYDVGHYNIQRRNIRIRILQQNQLRRSVIFITTEKKQHLAYNPAV